MQYYLGKFKFSGACHGTTSVLLHTHVHLNLVPMTCTIYILKVGARDRTLCTGPRARVTQ
eukprot:SAG31_NODE_906_length_11091_cov_22.589065_10_plen_60_part_00